MPPINVDRLPNRTSGLPPGIGPRLDSKGIGNYKERMRLLQENPDTANMPFSYTHSFLTNGNWWDKGPAKMMSVTEKQNSNCFATAAWVFGIEMELEAVWRAAINAGRASEANGLGDYVTFAYEDRPGYIGPDPMRAFLRFSDKVKLVKGGREGDLLTLWYAHPHNEECGFRIRHCGIIMQNGRVFEKESLDDGIRSDRTPAAMLADHDPRARRVRNWIFRLNGIG